MNKKILHKLTHGMYILSTNGAACFIDAASQISAGDNPLISVAVMKNNYTNQILKNENRFSISIFGMNDNVELIKNYGFQSMRDINKFQSSPTKVEIISNVPVITGTLGYIILDKVDTIETDTHTVFIGKVVEGEILKDEDPMSYNYYQAHKDDLMKVKSEQGKVAWVCSVCGYVYYGDTLPDDFTCPLCHVPSSMFEKK